MELRKISVDIPEDFIRRKNELGVLWVAIIRLGIEAWEKRNKPEKPEMDEETKRMMAEKQARLREFFEGVMR